jgi:hypothetical protein
MSEIAVAVVNLFGFKAATALSLALGRAIAHCLQGSFAPRMLETRKAVRGTRAQGLNLTCRCLVMGFSS